MNRKNKLRKVYLIYSIVLGEVFCIAFILCSAYIAIEPLQTIIKVIGFAGIVLVPVVVTFLYRWLKKDNAITSDELEQMVLTKAFAATGFVAISLLPFLLLFCSLFSQAAGYIAIGDAILIGTTFKFSTLYYHKKY